MKPAQNAAGAANHMMRLHLCGCPTHGAAGTHVLVASTLPCSQGKNYDFSTLETYACQVRQCMLVLVHH